MVIGIRIMLSSTAVEDVVWIYHKGTRSVYTSNQLLCLALAVGSAGM